MAKKPEALYGMALSRRAVKAYEDAAAQLGEAGTEITPAITAQLVQLAEWEDAAEDSRRMVKELRKKSGTEDVPEVRIRQVMRTIREAEASEREILNRLLLLPQKPRGRPPKEAAEDIEEDSEDDAWDSFDDDGGEAP